MPSRRFQCTCVRTAPLPACPSMALLPVPAVGSPAPVLPAVGSVEGSGWSVGWEGRFLQEKPLTGNRDVSRLDQGSVTGMCSCTCGVLTMVPCCRCVLALARAAGVALGRGRRLAPGAGSQAWEHPPAPGQSLTCFSEVPDQPTQGQSVQRGGDGWGSWGLACAVLATLAHSPLCGAPLFVGLRGHP